jgi:hypothetical protein
MLQIKTVVICKYVILENDCSCDKICTKCLASFDFKPLHLFVSFRNVLIPIYSHNYGLIIIPVKIHILNLIYIMVFDYAANQLHLLPVSILKIPVRFINSS